MGAEESRPQRGAHIEEASFDFRNEAKRPSLLTPEYSEQRPSFPRQLMAASRRLADGSDDDEDGGRDLPRLMKIRSAGWIDNATAAVGPGGGGRQEGRSRSTGDGWVDQHGWGVGGCPAATEATSNGSRNETRGR